MFMAEKSTSPVILQILVNIYINFKKHLTVLCE